MYLMQFISELYQDIVNNYVGITITILVIYFANRIHRYLIWPHIILNYYKRQGFIEINITKNSIRDIYDRKDALYSLKEFSSKYPNALGIIMPYTHLHSVILINKQLINKFLDQETSKLYKKDDQRLSFTKFIGSNILMSEGLEWQRRSKIIQQCLNKNNLQELIPKLQNITQNFFDDLISRNKFKSITGEIVLQIFLGDSMNNKQIWGLKLRDAMAKVLFSLKQVHRYKLNFSIIPQLLNFSLQKKIRDATEQIKQLKQLIVEIINEEVNKYQLITIKNDQESDQLLNIEQELQQNPLQQQFNMIKFCLQNKLIDFKNQKEVQDFANDIIIMYYCGKEPTAHLCMMASYYLNKNPSLMQLFEKECLSNDIFIQTESNIQNIQYSYAILLEVLRIYGPTVGLYSRIALKDHLIGNIKIKKGTRVNIGIMENHYDEKYFSDPFQFNPDRWIDNKINIKELLSFSADQRCCLGQQLALLESQIILKHFIKTFSYSLQNDYTPVMGMTVLYAPLNEMLASLNVKTK